ncbi:hypothetical protein [Kitasatospora sp. NPDC094011]|uniref:hypothetical protein n=1 Tax=Kitasatospora sp. NPDC094011 TaxID=3364090 RepID=UPI00380C3AF2
MIKRQMWARAGSRTGPVWARSGFPVLSAAALAGTMAVPCASAAEAATTAAAEHGKREFRAKGEWTVPEGVEEFTVYLWGPGGSAGGSGGGGGGGFVPCW